MIKYSWLARFDHSLSAKTIRRRIDNNDFVKGYNLERNDVSEDSGGNETDGKKIFRDMLSMEFLDYRLKIPDEMWRQVKRDIYSTGRL